jgi:hypothetical protein
VWIRAAAPQSSALTLQSSAVKHLMNLSEELRPPLISIVRDFLSKSLPKTSDY